MTREVGRVNCRRAVKICLVRDHRPGCSEGRPRAPRYMFSPRHGGVAALELSPSDVWGAMSSSAVRDPARGAPPEAPPPSAPGATGAARQKESRGRGRVGKRHFGGQAGVAGGGEQTAKLLRRRAGGSRASSGAATHLHKRNATRPERARTSDAARRERMTMGVGEGGGGARCDSASRRHPCGSVRRPAAVARC